MNSTTQARRVLSGMRPTGQLHLGNYHGALRNWVDLQHRHEGYFFVADWHALTTGYEDTSKLQDHIHEMVIDWLAAGIDPAVSTVFIQSQVPEHAELHLLLSMITPLGWLERVPTYKDQQAQLKDKDLATYGFLGYPLLQSADILLYRPQFVPVGEDQVAHVEITREVARRFNHLYGGGPEFEARVKVALKLLSGPDRAQYQELRRRCQEMGDAAAPTELLALLERQPPRVDAPARAVLRDYLHGAHFTILPEPQVLLTPTPKVPGLMAARCPSRMAIPWVCARSPIRLRRKCAPCRRIRRACAAPMPAIRPSARCGTCTRFTRTMRHKPGRPRAVGPRALGAWTASNP